VLADDPGEEGSDGTEVCKGLLAVLTSSVAASTGDARELTSAIVIISISIQVQEEIKPWAQEVLQLMHLSPRLSIQHVLGVHQGQP